MKRLFISFVILCVILCGCSSAANKLTEPVKFYYRVSTVSFNTDSGVIAGETREGVHFQNTLELLAAYLRGPVTDNLTCPFPSDVTVISVDTVNATCTVTLSKDFSALSGLDLTIACNCLGMTLLEHTGVNTVEIIAAEAELDGQKSVLITRNSFLLFDSSASETVPVEE